MVRERLKRHLERTRIATRDWLLGIRRLAAPPTMDPQTVRNPGRPPVVILPGVWERREATFAWARALADANFDVHFVPELDLELGSLDELSDRLLAWLETSQLHEAIIVAHSKGGLVGKAALIKNQQAFKGLIACGSPFEGAPIVLLTPLSFRLHSLRPGSSQIRKLQGAAHVNRRIAAVEAAWDQNVPRVESLPGAIRTVVPTGGHNELLEDPATAAEIVAIAEHISSRW